MSCTLVINNQENMPRPYVFGASTLEKVDEQILGVIIQKSLKPDKQVLKAVNSANQVLGMIKRTFVGKHKDVILHLYKALVRPRLEYCSQAWRPHLRKHIGTLEKVQ
jgi:ribonucleases P/MRP protein subunit RPP40